jgi:hypothetical protein
VNGNYQSIENSLSFVTEVVLGCKNGGAIYTLLNRKTPIITLLNQVLENRQLMDCEPVRAEAMRAAVTMIYSIGRYGYTKFEEAQFKLLAENTKM